MKELFKAKTVITFREYRKLNRKFPFKFIENFQIFFIFMTLFCFLCILDSEVVYEDILLLYLVFLGLFLLFLIFYYIVSIRINYKKELKNKFNHLNYDILFYNDSLEIKNTYSTKRLLYDSIKKVKESIDNIYLMFDENTIVIVQKNNCNQDLLLFFKDIIKNKKPEQFKKISWISTVEKTEYNKKVNLLMIIFILTIASFMWGIVASMFVLGFADINFSLYNIYTFAALIGLPIPIISIILGIKYKKYGIPCTKNIVGGIIVIILIITYISTSDSLKVNYDKIYKYEQIIGLEIPTKGEFVEKEWDESYLLEHFTGYAKFSDDNEIKKFEKLVKRNDRWLLAWEVETTLSILIPTNAICEGTDICYYSVYIDGIGYNTMPTITGEYHVYTMVYNAKNSILQIDDYFFQYQGANSSDNVNSNSI